MKTEKKELTASQQSHVDKQMKSFETTIAPLSGSKLLKYCVEAFCVQCLNEDGEEYSPKSKASIISALRKIAKDHFTAEAIELSQLATDEEMASLTNDQQLCVPDPLPSMGDIVEIKHQPSEAELKAIGEEYFPEGKIGVAAVADVVDPDQGSIVLNYNGATPPQDEFYKAPLTAVKYVSDEVVTELDIARKKREMFLGVPTHVNISNLGIYVIAIDQSKIAEPSALGVHLVEMLFNHGGVATATGGLFSSDFYRIATEEEVYEHNTPMALKDEAEYRDPMEESVTFQVNEDEVALGEEHAVNENPVRAVSYPIEPATITMSEEGVDDESTGVKINYTSKADLVKKVYKLTGERIHANCFTWKSTLEARAEKALKSAGFNKVSLNKV